MQFNGVRVVYGTFCLCAFKNDLIVNFEKAQSPLGNIMAFVFNDYNIIIRRRTVANCYNYDRSNARS